MQGTQMRPNEELLVDYVVDRVTGRASGHYDSLCKGNLPHDVYFVGNFRPAPDQSQDMERQLKALFNKLSPYALGGTFCFERGDTNSVVLDVTLHWACFYPVTPTLDEQRAWQQRHPAQLGAAPQVKQDSGPSGSKKARKAPERGDSIYPKYRKIICQASGRLSITKTTGKDAEIDVGSLQGAINGECHRAQAAVFADPEHLKYQPDATRSRVPQSALDGPASWSDYLSILTREISPDWAWAVACSVDRMRIDGNQIALSVQFSNVSKAEDIKELEPFLFDAVFELTVSNGSLRPMLVELMPRGFRYSREISGRGFNCGVEQTARATIRSTNVPRYNQRRLRTQDTPTARFNDLAKDPLPVLQDVHRAMRKYEARWDEINKTFRAQSHWTSEFQAEFDRDRASYVAEIKRFERGLEILQTDADALLAFQLAHHAFVEMNKPKPATKQKSAWRLFQLVFLVTQLPSIYALKSKAKADLEDRGYVDVIYFPTGGGKTEAYLAVMVFHLFFDRLRGKAAGTTAWTRFPLRLLTVQQMQRLAEAVCAAELIRVGQQDKRLSGSDIDGFSIGYFVGEDGSPNQIANPQNVHEKSQYRYLGNWTKANDPTARQDWKRITTCPSCGTESITVDFDPDSCRLYHKCQKTGCRFPHGWLPVVITDNEIFRTLPSVVVGTLDKLASIANQRKMVALFGDVDGRCSVHGYTKVQCFQDGCRDKKLINKKVPAGISGPTLMIQDELHLLKEGLGTFDSHYEGYVATYLSDVSADGIPKYIASSGTIENYERQAEHLYGVTRDRSRVFPVSGPSADESFYAMTESTVQRTFLGVLSHNKTLLNAGLELLQLYHEEVQSLSRIPNGAQSPFGGTVTPGSAGWTALLDPYLTSLVYFSSQPNLNEMRTDFDNEVNANLSDEGFRPVSILEMTGKTTTAEVTRNLEKLEKIASAGDTPVSVFATSMISHGVDVDRLNAMCFYGMPRQNAEYIQASSRVGRSHHGLVLVAFKPPRERDQSHFSYFQKFHEFLGQLVEPVAINRWATYSIERTLPGLFMAFLLQRIGNRITTGNPNIIYKRTEVANMFARGQITAAEIVAFLSRAYYLDRNSHEGAASFDRRLAEGVKQCLHQIVGATKEMWASGALYPHPMTSLRDVDEAVVVEIDRAGLDWGTRRGGTRS